MENIQEKRNNARMTIINRHVPVTNIEPYDIKQGVYFGDVVADTSEHANMDYSVVYFSDHYDPEKNDYDRVLTTFAFKDDLLGVSFRLIPLQKILFGFDPATKGIKQQDGKIIYIQKPPVNPLSHAQLMKKKRGGRQ